MTELLSVRHAVVALRFLGRDTRNGGSPTLYATDRDSYIVQGWKVEGRGDRVVEIPHSLLAHLEHGTCFSVEFEDTGSGTFLLSGVPLADLATLAIISPPEHEQCIEVAMRAQIRPVGDSSQGRTFTTDRESSGDGYRLRP
ncbi:hypothetical protein [Nocardia sp. NPDC058666]|uniref:hypothetical protein n=1 Tax=unclassified Nocardia TaxID=2637762 RepID=UPI0036673EEC